MFGVPLNLVSENQSVSLNLVFEIQGVTLNLVLEIQSVPLNLFGACLVILGCVPLNSGGVPLNSGVSSSSCPLILFFAAG